MKKKRIYSKRKEPYIVTDRTIDNPIQLLEEIFQFENKWSKFIDEVIYKRKSIEQPYHQNLLHIMNQIKDHSLQKQIVSVLMNANYNPYIDELPLYEFPENQRNLLKKIQDNLYKQVELVEKEKMKESFNLMVKGHVYRTMMIKNQVMPVSQYLFDSGYDVVIVVGKAEVVFTSNPTKKPRPDFSLIHSELQKIEPDIWYLHGSNGILKTEKGKRTHLKISEILPIFFRKELNLGYNTYTQKRILKEKEE